jgi:hypothetical protein
VDGKGCVCVRTNGYSTPLKPGTRVEVAVLPAHVDIRHAGALVARHARCYGRRQQVLDLEHYLDVLERKPGALAGSTPLAQWRQAGRWPDSFDCLWRQLNDRHGRPAGTRHMIELLQLGKQHGHARLVGAVEAALRLGAHDAAAVRYLLTADSAAAPRVPPLEVGALARYERPLPTLAAYDRLLSGRTS